VPPRYSYWTILAGGLPTAFRATERDELLPTFQRLREKHPDAEMKWFARGKLWNSPEEARRAGDRDASHRAPADGERRGRDWRPGGSHRDPRQKFVDAKKARNASRRQERFDHRQRAEGRRSDGRRTATAGAAAHRPTRITRTGAGSSAGTARAPAAARSRLAGSSAASEGIVPRSTGCITPWGAAAAEIVPVARTAAAQGRRGPTGANRPQAPRGAARSDR
jgi:hypothetical protein